jgi:hypothetical protein
MIVRHLAKTKTHALVLTALLFGLSAVASFQGATQRSRRIRFPPGRTTLVLKGVLKGEADATYVLRARAGQTLNLHLAVENDCCAALLVKGPDGINLTNADGTDAGDDFSVVLQKTGDYRIIVFPPDTADRKDLARYTLEVSAR